MSKSINSYSLQFVAVLKNQTEFKNELKELSKTTTVDLTPNLEKFKTFTDTLKAGFDTTVRINVDTSSLRSTLDAYKINNNLTSPLTVDDFIARSTTEKFNTQVQEMSKSVKKFLSLESQLNQFRKADGFKSTDTRYRETLNNYKKEYETIKSYISELSSDSRFKDLASYNTGLNTDEIKKITRERFSSISRLNDSIINNLGFSNKEASANLTDSITAQEQEFERIKANLKEFGRQNNITDIMGINNLSLDKLAEAVQMLKTLESLQAKLKANGVTKRITGDLKAYETAFNEKFTRTQELTGVASTVEREPITITTSEQALLGLREQLAAGLNNIPITSFEATSAIATLKESIETQLQTVSIGQTITLRRRGSAQQEPEDNIVLPSVVIGSIELAPDAATKLKNDIQSLLNNVVLDPMGNEQALAEALEKVNKTYQKKLTKIARDLKHSIEAPTIQEFDATAAIDKLKQQINNALRSFSFDINGRVAHGTISTGSDEMGRAKYKTYDSLETGVGELVKSAGSNISKLTEMGSITGASELLTKYNDFMTKIEQFKTAFRQVDANGTLVMSLENANRQMAELVTQSHILNDNFTQISSVHSINNRLDNTASRIKAMVDSLSKYEQTDAIKDLRQGLVGADGTSGLLKQVKALKANIPNKTIADANTEMMALIHSTEEFENRFAHIAENTPLTREINSAMGAVTALQKRILSLQDRMQKALSANSRGFSIDQYKQRFDEIYRATQTDALTSNDINALDLRFKTLMRDMREAGVTGKSFTDVMKGMFAKFGSWSIVTATIQRVVMTFRRMLAAIQDVDTALTNLRKVTKATESDITKFMKGVGDAAYKMGASVSDLISATAEFSRLGYDLTQAQKLGELATMYKTVAEDLDITTASQSIVSTLKAFEKAGVSAERIVDVFNYIGNNFAISSAGIGEAMQRSAASLQTANNSLEQSVALITAANEVTQDPIKVGTAMKTLSARIRGSKSELTELGEDIDFLAEGTSKLRNEILALSGVDIMVDDTTFKSTYQIIDELSTAYQGMVETSQARLAEMLGGKNQANIISALLENFDTARKAYAEATSEADGSAQKELATALDSINGKVSQLTATWQTFATDVLESDVFKGIIDGANMFLKTLDKLIGDSNTLIELVPMIFAGVGIAKNKTGLGEPKNQRVLYICPEFASHINNRLYAA